MKPLDGLSPGILASDEGYKKDYFIIKSREER